MKNSFHIHIGGMVQGVGFRPFVCKLADRMRISGTVSNSTNGVHIEINAEENEAHKFYNHIITHPPQNAVITKHSIEKIAYKEFTNFEIKESEHQQPADLLLTPDIATCNECTTEILNSHNKRYHYAFTTCLNCGPRYSITKALPYDRINTTMQHIEMCDDCHAEYNNTNNIRHYSQTNSCPECAIEMHFYSSPDKEENIAQESIVQEVISKLSAGKIVAVKAIGGYLLLCDASNATTIKKLRKVKHRSSKPFALLYASVKKVEADVHLSSSEKEILQSNAAPIVLCTPKDNPQNIICRDLIAPALTKIGIMLPASPLLLLIAEGFQKPLIATSANISEASIIYTDEEAVNNLFNIADYVLSYDREILIPQDDSVIQFTNCHQKIIIRRGRGLAPNYFSNPFQNIDNTILATGADMKSAFAVLHKHNLYVSQYLGDLSSFETQQSYAHTLQHINSLLHAEPEIVISDKHPGYTSHNIAKTIAREKNLPIIEVQHHKAHFSAVLAENNLLHSSSPVLGLIWDGTGYGDDEQIWGGEVFSYENYSMERLTHLACFPHLQGDKMSKEPRLSALSLLKNFPQEQSYIQHAFTNVEWQYYQKLLQQPATLKTSSMGRFLDAVAFLLGFEHNTYESEAVMQMEAMATMHKGEMNEYYNICIQENEINFQPFIKELLQDIANKKSKSELAYKVIYSLAKAIGTISDFFKINTLAFSGGVFQNALLVELIKKHLHQKQLYFHQQLSPNDECISFGQLAYYEMTLQNNKIFSTKNIQHVPGNTRKVN